MSDRQRRQLVIVSCWWIGLLFALLWIRFPYVQGLFQQPPPIIYSLYIFTIVYLVLRTVTVVFLTRWFIYDHLLLVPDLLLLTIGVYFTGGIQSDLYLAFFIPIVSCGLVLKFQFTLFIALLVSVLHLVATWHDRFVPSYWEYIVTRSFFFSVVGWLVSSIARQEEERQRRESMLKQELAILRERQSIARELHDSAGNAIVAAIQQGQLCERLIESSPEEAKKQLQDHVTNLRHTLAEMRELVFHVRPVTSSSSGFIDALRQYGHRFSQRTGIQLDTAVNGDVLLPPEVQISILRIIQEATTNAVKHGKATKVNVHLRVVNRKLMGTVTDNGIGFDLSQTQKGFGLQTMQERINTFGGTLTVKSQKGVGTTVEFSLPL